MILKDRFRLQTFDAKNMSPKWLELFVFIQVDEQRINVNKKCINIDEKRIKVDEERVKVDGKHQKVEGRPRKIGRNFANLALSIFKVDGGFVTVDRKLITS